METARALRELPAVAAVAEAGGVSMAQLVPLTVVAVTATDERWAQEGPSMTPAALALLARQQRRVEREEAERQHRRRSFRWWRDRHGLGVRFAGLLPDDQAAVVTGAVERVAEAAPRNADGTFEAHESRCADALVELASTTQAAAGVVEVVVHVPVVLAREPHLSDGTVLSIDTIRRLACDATARLLVENPDGTVAGYGRRKRIVPDKMRARLWQRDSGCRWHGCSNRRGVKAHHIAALDPTGTHRRGQLRPALPPPPPPRPRRRLDHHRRPRRRHPPVPPTNHRDGTPRRPHPRTRPHPPALRPHRRLTQDAAPTGGGH